MKKVIILSLFMLVLITFAFANNPRAYMTKIVTANIPNYAITDLVTNLSGTTSPNYRLTADILETPNEVLSSENNVPGTTYAGPSLLRIYNSSGTVYLYLQLSAFQTQWQSGQTVRWVITYIGPGPYNGQSTTWDLVIPGTPGATTGTTVTDYNPPRVVPPFSVGPTHDYPMLPTAMTPADSATGIDANNAVLAWTVNHDADYMDPTGFKLYCGTDPGATSLLDGVLVAGGTGAHTYNLPALQPNTRYYWKVVPTSTSPGKNIRMQEIKVVMLSRVDAKNGPKADTPNVPTMTFTTAAVVPQTAIVLVTSNVNGMDILRNGVSTNHETPFSFTENVGEVITYSVEPNPLMVTPSPQQITVGNTPVVFFQYTPLPNSLGNQIVNLSSSDPVVVHLGPVGNQYHITVTPAGGIVTGQLIFNVMESAPATKFNYAGFTNVSVVVQVWATSPTILNGTNVQVNYQTDVPFEVVVHWADEVEEQPDYLLWPTWYPGPAPSVGYTFNNGPHGPIWFPLGTAPFTASSFVDGTPLNTLVIGPLPTLPGGLRALLELVLMHNVPDLPVELSSFTAVSTAQMFVNLQWTTESETNNLGFNVLRSTQSDPATAQKVNESLIAGTNSEIQHSYNFIDEDVAAGTTYYYWLEMVSLAGVNELSNNVTVRVTNNTPPVFPVATTMSKAYPNPFSATHRTQIDVNVKANETATVTVYNILGQAIRTWTVKPGTTTLQWDGKDSKGTTLGCGVYFAKMTSPSKTMTTKMLIVK